MQASFSHMCMHAVTAEIFTCECTHAQESALMQFCTLSMSTMLAITKYGVCVGIIAPCLVNFIMADMEPDGVGTKLH